MTGGGVLLTVIARLAVGLLPATLVVVVRGGRGPDDPPASHPRTGPAWSPATVAGTSPLRRRRAPRRRARSSAVVRR